MSLAGALLPLALAAAGATATPVGPNVISTQPVAWTARGVALVYERYFPARFSALVVVGGREGGSGDYSALTFNLGLEGRLWFLRDPAAPGPTPGPYLGLRVGLGYTHVSDRVARRALGSSAALEHTLWFGFRFVLFRRVELTPSLGLGTRWDADPGGRLSGFGRPVVTAGLSTGWMF